MTAKQAYLALLFAPLGLAMLLLAPSALAFPPLCAGLEAAVTCAWQNDMARALTASLHQIDSILFAANAPVVLGYCAFAALVSHFAYTGFWRRACSATCVGFGLGLGLMVIHAGADATATWANCASLPKAPLCQGDVAFVALYYLALAGASLAIVFVPLGFAVSFAHGIVLGIIYGARDDRSYS